MKLSKKSSKKIQNFIYQKSNDQKHIQITMWKKGLKMSIKQVFF